MNYLDSARIGAALKSGGHNQAEREEEADIIFVNSCAVTRRAEKQSRQETSKSERQGKQVAVFGCSTKVSAEEWEKKFPGVLIFQTEEELLAHFSLSVNDLDFPLSDRTRIPIAVQTGCDNLCTFCITRIARGKTEDFPLEGILQQIDRAYFVGMKEIVLTGIQLASWGCGDSLQFPEKTKLPFLLREILQKTKIERIRMSSLGPQFLNDEFFEVFSDERICDHLHLSVQSGSEKILQKMNRGHNASCLSIIAKKARKVRPHVALTSDAIVGFPSEEEKDFEDTKALFHDLQFAKIHVFPFSPRQGTGAENMPQVNNIIKKHRAADLRSLGKSLQQQFSERQIGRTVSVLVEEKQEGLSTNYVRLSVPKEKPGSIIEIKITPEIIRSHHS